MITLTTTIEERGGALIVAVSSRIDPPLSKAESDFKAQMIESVKDMMARTANPAKQTVIVEGDPEYAQKLYDQLRGDK